MEESLKLIEFATRGDAQAAIVPLNRSGPTNKDSVASIDAKYMADLPSNPANFEVAIPDDPEFWIDNFDDLNERWAAWAGTN
jgi:putative spermidine/putrescine transport system substrate-binding protein